MSEPLPEFSLAIASHNAGVFGRAPEARADRKEPEPPPVDADTIIGVIADNSELRERAEQAEADLELYRDDELDRLAAADVEDLVLSGQAEDVANTLAYEAGVDDWRTQGYIEEWHARDPVAATRWLDTQLNAARTAQIEAQTEEARAQIETQQQQSAAAIEREMVPFFGRHEREFKSHPALFHAVQVGLAATREQDPSAFASGRVNATLEGVYGRARELVAAQVTRQSEHELRSEFAKPSFADVMVGRAKAQPVPPTLEDVLASMGRRPEDRAAQRAQNVARFREEFANADNRTTEFAEQNKKGASEAMRAAARARAEDEIRSGRR